MTEQERRDAMRDLRLAQESVTKTYGCLSRREDKLARKSLTEARERLKDACWNIRGRRSANGARA